MYFVHLEAIWTAVSPCTDAQHASGGISPDVLVSCIAQQAVQHAVLASCTYFSQLNACKAECWVNYTILGMFHCINPIRVMVAYQGAT